MPTPKRRRPGRRGGRKHVSRPAPEQTTQTSTETEETE
jgi:hypothetical protein